MLTRNSEGLSLLTVDPHPVVDLRLELDRRLVAGHLLLVTLDRTLPRVAGYHCLLAVGRLHPVGNLEGLKTLESGYFVP